MDTRVGVVCGAYAAALASMGRAMPGAEVYDGPDVLLVTGRADHPAGHFALRCRAAAGVARGLRFFRERGRPCTWVVMPVDAPADLPGRLVAAGLRPAGGLTGMCLEQPLALAPPAGVTLQEAGPDTAVAVRAALETLHGQVFSLPAHVNALLLLGMWGQVDSPPSPRRGRLYYAAAGGAPVGLCYALPAAGTVGLYSVGTDRAWRGLGIAGALVSRAAADGLAAGAGSAVLHAVKGAEGVYRRAGFVPVCRFQLFTGGAPGP